MGTRGSFGVIIGEKEKIGYNQFDSYPSGHGVEVLAWLLDADLAKVREQAEKLRVVSDDVKPTVADIEALKPYTDLNVSEGTTEDWYCLTRQTHGSIAKTLECGYVLDSSNFPLDSLFCEWAYIVDLDKNVFEVYEGFKKRLPTEGRWAGRPTAEENAANHKRHLEWCSEHGREPWEEETPVYKAVQLIASWPLDALPTTQEFLDATEGAEGEEEQE